MTIFRYSRWDGSQQLPAFDADDVLDALSDDILAEGDVRRALQRLMQRGIKGTRGGDIPGLRKIMERLRAQRQAQLERANLDGVLEDLNRRLEEILETEREGIAERVRASVPSIVLRPVTNETCESPTPYSASPIPYQA